MPIRINLSIFFDELSFTYYRFPFGHVHPFSSFGPGLLGFTLVLILIPAVWSKTFFLFTFLLPVSILSESNRTLFLVCLLPLRPCSPISMIVMIPVRSHVAFIFTMIQIFS